MIDNFYQGFHHQVEDANENVERSQLSTNRELGLHPNGKMITVKLGKFGPYVQAGEADYILRE